MNKKRNFIGAYIIIISVLVLSYLTLEAINALEHLDNMQDFVKTPLKIKEEFYDLSNIKFKRIYLSGKYSLKKTCMDGCNLSVSRNKRTVYYMITHRDDGYYYDMSIDKKLLIDDKYFGTSIDDAYIDYYIKNMVLFNTFDDQDYMVIINQDYKHSEYKSLGANTLALTDSGIEYNYGECGNETDTLIRVRRVAFTNRIEEINRTETHFNWCM